MAACSVSQEKPKSEQAFKQKQIHGAQLNPSILLFHKSHHTNGKLAVRRAANTRCSQVNMVVSLFCKLDKQRQVLSYGLEKKGKFVPLNPKLLTEFKKSLEDAFSEAVAYNLDISILVHLNSSGEIHDWRNNFLFDPLKEHNGYSYQEALINPIAEVLAETIKPKTKINFSIAGEMGRSVFSFPDSYANMLEALRNDNRLANCQMGISFNFSSVNGEAKPITASPISLDQLIQRCDFVGLSQYRGFELPAVANDFQLAKQAFLEEMKQAGVEIPTEMPLHFSEVGIGGTSKGRDSKPQETAHEPWTGTDDPEKNPWESPEMRRLRIEYHLALLEFLSKPSRQNPVTEAFLWSEGSWDPMDMNDRGFSDQAIIELIQMHNEKVK